MTAYDTTIKEIQPGIFRIPIPVPLPLQFVYAYAIWDPEGFWLIDLGMDVDEARLAWDQADRDLGLGQHGIAGIIVTHYHPDHIGLAQFADEKWHAPIYLLEQEIMTARSVFEDTPPSPDLTSFMIQHGTPSDQVVLLEQEQSMRRTIVHLPPVMHALQAGHRFTLTNHTLQIVHQRGHTDHQAVVYDEVNELLFCGDQVLSRITPNISFWPNSDPNPLASYLDSLNELKAFPVRLALPAHEHLIDNLVERIDAIIAHHQERTAAVAEIVSHTPKTGYEVAKELFKRPLNAYQMRFAVSETLAHLEYLRLSGTVNRMEESPIRYRARASLNPFH